MEVGAVKQAFNNEVIQLKKNLNQAKLQVIHKLTRKAKTLTEKKTPEHLKEKNRKKAESAVKEVLIMKKLKPRDIAKFIITYKGELNSHLNKPTVDSDKACARLLLHKALQQKYKSIKDTFGDIPIKDLLMSRQERRKLKKEAKDAQKNKKKGKAKVVNSEGDWNVEDVKMSDSSKEIDNNDDEKQDDDVSNNGNQDDDEVSNDYQEIGDDDDDDDDTPGKRLVVNDSDESSAGEQSADDDDPGSTGGDSDDENMEKEECSDDGSQDSGSDEEIETENLVKLKPAKQAKPKPKPVHPATANLEDALPKPRQKKKSDKKIKENKNKNLNEKMLNRQFKKDTDSSQNVEKVVDPFFKTATGENYMSVAEQRQPDEVKEIHRQGNRQERRAAMFGRGPIRPRRDDRQNFRSDKYNGNSSSKFSNSDGNDRRSKYNDRNSFNNRNSNFNDSKFNDRNSKFNDGNSKFNDRDSNFNDKKINNNVTEPKAEKLHPSWEAKKKQSGILPFKGKKIVFDES